MPIETVNPEKFAELERDDRLETIAEKSLDGLATEIRRIGPWVSEN